MKTASPELIAHLAANTQFLQADLYEFTLLDGRKIRSTSWDVDVVDGAANHLLQADQLGSAPWIADGCTVQANVIAGPDGVVDGDLIIEGAGTNGGVGHKCFQTLSGLLVGGTSRIAFKAKAGTRTWAQAWNWGTYSTESAYFDLVNGKAYSPLLTCNPTITPLADGWFRCERDTTALIGTSLMVGFGPSDGTQVQVYNGDGVSGCYITDCQVIKGSMRPGPFVATAAAAIDNRITFPTSGLKILRDTTRCVVGLEVDSLSINISPSANDKVSGIGFIAAVNNGLLDGASFTLKRAFLSDPQTVVGSVVLFSGMVSECDFSRTSVNMKVKSELERLNINIPRNVYLPGCRWTFGGVGCTFNRETLVATGMITHGGSVRTLTVSGLTQPTGYFDQGVIQFLTGQLAGIKRTVLQMTSPVTGDDVIILGLPLPKSPVSGDTFRIYPGCDKTMAKCSSYGNLINYGGQPFIPVPETAK
jgi:uncharacterized phage protein (TIGR02218 family)